MCVNMKYSFTVFYNQRSCLCLDWRTESREKPTLTFIITWDLDISCVKVQCLFASSSTKKKKKIATTVALSIKAAFSISMGCTGHWMRPIQRVLPVGRYQTPMAFDQALSFGENRLVQSLGHYCPLWS